MLRAEWVTTACAVRYQDRFDDGHLTLSVPKAGGEGWDRYHHRDLIAKGRGKGKGGKSSGANPSRPPRTYHPP